MKEAALSTGSRAELIRKQRRGHCQANCTCRHCGRPEELRSRTSACLSLSKTGTPCPRCASALASVRLPIQMRALVVALLAALRSTVRSRAALAAEVLALRHQLAVLRRQAPRRLHLCRTDRFLWVWLSRAWSEWRPAVQL